MPFVYLSLAFGQWPGAYSIPGPRKYVEQPSRGVGPLFYLLWGGLGKP